MRQRRPCGRSAGDDRVIGGSQLTNQHGQRSTVADQVVHGDGQQVVRRIDLVERGAHQRFVHDGKRYLGVGACGIKGTGGVSVPGTAMEPRDHVGGSGDLCRAAVHIHEPCAQHRLTLLHKGEGLRQGNRVQRALNAHRSGHVVRRAGATHGFEKPQTLLRQG